MITPGRTPFQPYSFYNDLQIHSSNYRSHAGLYLGQVYTAKLKPLGNVHWLSYQQNNSNGQLDQRWFPGRWRLFKAEGREAPVYQCVNHIYDLFTSLRWTLVEMIHKFTLLCHDEEVS